MRELGSNLLQLRTDPATLELVRVFIFYFGVLGPVIIRRDVIQMPNRFAPDVLHGFVQK
jgi:hypothetical protein